MQLLLAAICVTSGALAWFEWRRARLLERRIQELTLRLAQPPAPVAPVEPPVQPAVSQPAAPDDMRRLKHDLKSPLTSILCFCSLLKQTSADLTPKQVDYLAKIQGSVNGILVLLKTPDRVNGQPEQHRVE